ncbi:hypothetical protein F4X73_15260 [Candidatus Poribacteria bacterium]|nr:hypothetical protein [Candidatus Poribacteria bacterium]MYF54668.1 hypothetical protein [Candidatus Poribacteria bacterium]
MNKGEVSIQQSEFFVKNKRTDLKIIPYIGCKAGFSDIFDKIIPDNLACHICDVFGGGGAFSFYACNRFGSHRVTYNDNNPIVVNLIRHVQKSPQRLWELYNEHYLIDLYTATPTGIRPSSGLLFMMIFTFKFVFISKR